MKNNIFLISAFLWLFLSCDKKEETDPKLIFIYSFDENGERLDNFGQPASIPSGHAAQTPSFNQIGIHSIELIHHVASLPTTNSLIYKGAEKNINGENVIDFDKEIRIREGEVLAEIPLKDIAKGSYNYLRNSLGYQNYNVDFLHNDSLVGPLDLNAQIASFVGFKTYISSFDISGETITVNGVEPQGYWAFHVDDPVTFTQTGHAPVTTVPNPLDNVSPIPLGSCLVTGAFEQPLVITGDEEDDIVVHVYLTINKSFEWIDSHPDGKYEPAIEQVVDMGTRGLKAIVE